MNSIASRPSGHKNDKHSRFEISVYKNNKYLVKFIVSYLSSKINSIKNFNN